MAKRRSRTRVPGLDKFENIHQIGGIVTGTLDAPSPGRPSRVAHVDTGSGLRLTVALDRGGDIVEAFYLQHNLAYLTQVGHTPPDPARFVGLEWLRGWSGGLVTTCGPQTAGQPRQVDGMDHGLHGRFSNTPAMVEMLLNPDPWRGRREMLLSMVIRDARMFGPVLEVRRQIQCVLGLPEIRIYDQVTNRGNAPCHHAWLYHVNLGYPLLDQGAQLIYSGKVVTAWRNDGKKLESGPGTPILSKRVPAPLREHAGTGERGVVVLPKADRDGLCHVGLVNRELGLGFELEYPLAALPRFANWQHFGQGSYTTGLEPYRGSLLGEDVDPIPESQRMLAPGQTQRYQLTLRVHSTAAALSKLASYDGAVK